MLLAIAGSALAGVHYVDVNSTNATPPYTNWTTAATNIQDAVDAAVAGDEIVVTNGTYATGGRAVDGTMTNRVAVDKPLTLRSVNGPQFTIIQGYQVPGTIVGDGAIRCVYLANGANLSGFTLTNGSTRVVRANPTNRESSGGGLWCEFTNTVAVSNCVATGNSAYEYGGGVYGGLLNNCTLTGNWATGGYSSDGDGGGAAYCTLNNCTLTGNSAYYGGAGAAFCTLNNCTLTGNSGRGAYSSTLNDCALTGNSGGGANSCELNNCTLSSNSVVASYAAVPGYAARGGGAFLCHLINCTLTGNSARSLANQGAAYGGGAYECTLINCTLTGNSVSATSGGIASGGGVSGGTLINCIVYYNTGGNYDTYYDHPRMNFCCTTPQPTNGFGNIRNAPVFVDTNAWSNLRLQSNSPCINAGNNSYVTNATDLDGNPRIAGGTVDIGAYEFQSPASMISYAWLQQYGLPIDPATDTADPDGDGVDNYHEWLAGTEPTNRFSSPAQLTIIPSRTNVILTWPTNAVGFSLQSATNLGSSAWSTNSPAPAVVNGQNIVTNPITGSQQFFRLVH